MEEIALHILDIVENSITSGATEIRVKIDNSDGGDLLTITIADNGSGMDEHERKKALDPFFTTKAGKQFGLGLALFKQAAEETGGAFDIESGARTGTTVRADFYTDHPDMKPLGDIEDTVALLGAYHPEINFIFEGADDEA